MDLESLYYYAKVKGINVIGTGDFTHPEYFSYLQDYLEPAESGLFKLKDEYAQKQDEKVPEKCKDQTVRFLLSVEISNIYKKNDKVRKMHNLIFAPSFVAASKISSELGKIGNISSDGRPILGLDSKELLKISLNSDPLSFFVPAHIWTPWFSMFGSKSGFNSIDEAFDELAKEITVVETGLSSDPFMNWRLSALDNITLISNSDAHSPAKLGREANLFNCKLSYPEIIGAIKTGDKRFLGTIEFFPQEGKYHYDGHRKCNVCFEPSESIRNKNLCPKCKKPLVLGVDHRVNELADRPHDFIPKKHKQVEYIIPLSELIAEIRGVKSSNAVSVQKVYWRAIENIGNEFYILMNAPINKIAEKADHNLAEAIKRMRAKNIIIKPGYDGVFGEIKVFKDRKDITESSGQLGLLQ